jgi:hypothetical protein
MKTKKKVVKGWAILGAKNRIVSIELSKKKPGFYTIGTWSFYAEKGDKSIVPCTITYPD